MKHGQEFGPSWLFIIILLGHEGQEILLLLFSSLESHAIVSVVTAITWP